MELVRLEFRFVGLGFEVRVRDTVSVDVSVSVSPAFRSATRLVLTGESETSFDK